MSASSYDSSGIGEALTRTGVSSTPHNAISSGTAQPPVWASHEHATANSMGDSVALKGWRAQEEPSP